MLSNNFSHLLESRFPQIVESVGKLTLFCKYHAFFSFCFPQLDVEREFIPHFPTAMGKIISALWETFYLDCGKLLIFAVSWLFYCGKVGGFLVLGTFPQLNFSAFHCNIVLKLGDTLMEVTLDQYWSHTLFNFRTSQELDEVVFKSFYASSKLANLNDSVATIIVENSMQKMVMSSNIDPLQKELANTIGRFVGCHIVLQNELGKTPMISTAAVEAPSVSDGILSHFTFENFVVGPSNRESHAAALATAYSPGKYYNPLFIYGNSGLGKTHLLNAIGNYIKKNKSSLYVKYIPCMEFVSSYIQSIRNNTIDEFNEDYRKIDVLLVDDIQFLAGKEKSHEMFFHLFNDLVNNRKQVVISSDRHPDDLKGLEMRLVSRFSSGLSIGIDSPEFETALAILQNKLSNHSVDVESIDEDVLSYIASRFASDVRKLEGALNRIIFYSINFSESHRISLDVAMQAFKGMDTCAEGEELTIERIKSVVSDYYGLTKQQLISKSRTSNIANARHIAIYLSRKHLNIPFVKIGEAYGKRDHSTIMSSFEKIDKLLKDNSLYQNAIKEIEKILNAK